MKIPDSQRGPGRDRRAQRGLSTGCGGGRCAEAGEDLAEELADELPDDERERRRPVFTAFRKAMPSLEEKWGKAARGRRQMAARRA